jgi:hypothetical protein
MDANAVYYFAQGIATDSLYSPGELLGGLLTSNQGPCFLASECFGRFSFDTSEDWHFCRPRRPASGPAKGGK